MKLPQIVLLHSQQTDLPWSHQRGGPPLGVRRHLGTLWGRPWGHPQDHMIGQVKGGPVEGLTCCMTDYPIDGPWTMTRCLEEPPKGSRQEEVVTGCRRERWNLPVRGVVFRLPAGQFLQGPHQQHLHRCHRWMKQRDRAMI